MTAPTPFQPPATMPPPPQAALHHTDAMVAPTVLNVVAYQQPNGVANLAMVLGIVALAFSFVPIIGMAAWVIAPLAIVFGVIGAFKPVDKAKSHAGWIMGAVALMVCLAWVAAYS